MKSSVNMRLAINGGAKTVTAKAPVWPRIGQAEIRAVLRTLKTEQLSQLDAGGSVGRFEKAFAKYHGRKHGMAVSSGTAALQMALAACGVGPGVEVITTPYSWGATTGCILHQNGIPVFVDIDPRTLCIDPAKIESAITPRTRAICLVHIYGHPCDMDAIMNVAHKHRLFVVEDCAQAHGARYKGRLVGTFGHFGCFSLQGSKNMTAGEGGVIICDDDRLYELLVMNGSHTVRQNAEVTDPELRRYNDSLFFNYRPHPLGIAIAEVHLKSLKRWVANRQRNAERLAARLDGVPGVRPPYVAPQCEHGYHMVPLFYRGEEVGNVPRTAFIKACQAEGVPMWSYVNLPIPLRPRHRDLVFYGGAKGCPWHCPHATRKIEYRAGMWPVAEKHCAEHELNMPAYHEPVPRLIDQLASAIRKVAEHADEIPVTDEDRKSVAVAHAQTVAKQPPPASKETTEPVRW